MKETNFGLSYKWIALSCTTLGALLSVINGNTLIVALPVISKELNASFSTIMWTVMIYLLSLTILVPVFGRVADMIGRKKLYVLGFAVFTASSLMCGLANSGAALVAGRFIQSIGGALLVANSTAIVADAFPSKQLGQALGINTMVIGAGAVVGPVLGGILTSWHWRWVFFFNIPLGIIGTLWAALQLREIIKLPENQSFDWWGTLTFSAGFTIILIALTAGQMLGWLNPWVLGGFAVGIIFSIIFIMIENRVAQPMLDLSLFKDRLLASAYLSTLLNGIARGAVSFLMIFFFQGVKGIDPLMAGILLTPFAAAMTVIAPFSGVLSDRYGSRALSFIGLTVSAIGLWGLTRLQINTTWPSMMFWMVLMGLGSGFFFSPNTNAIMGAVPPERRGIAAGTRTMMNNAGAVISLAVGMTLITSSMTPEALQGLFAGTHVGGQGIMISEFLNGLHQAFWISFLISVLAALISLTRGGHSYFKPAGAQSEDC